jgi:predicted secreted protein
MALGDTDTGYGVAVTFQSGIVAKVRSVRISASRDSLDATHASSANNAMEFIPQAFYDAGECEIEMLFNPAKAWLTALTAVAETVTVTWPNVGTSAGTWAASGFLKNIEIDAPYDDIMTVSATLKFTGQVTYTAAT